MCGRYLLSYDLSKILEELAKQWKDINTDEIKNYNPSYNIAPFQTVYVLAEDNHSIRVKKYKWGVPYSNFNMINTKSESIIEKKKNIINDFKPCLILSNGFYEWKKEGIKKTPFLFSFEDFSMFYFLGIYRKLKDEEYCSILTTKPSKVVKDIHHRMPVIKRETNKKEWLSQNLKSINTLDLFEPFSDNSFNKYQVSTFVNSTSNNSPKCIEPYKDSQLNFFN
ncbi:MAG: SOS response-associated peptidase [Bacillota bacterium]|nr:SOS response-associated peptidase [Bacillota bacterium]